MMGLVFTALVIMGCHGHRPGVTVGEREFNTHCTNRLTSVSHFISLSAADDAQLKSVKFIVTNFRRPKHHAVLYLDGRFYEMHDEWYWYSRLNGVAALGEAGLRLEVQCDTPKACAKWGMTRSELPMGLQFVENRMYSQHFYDLALKKKREIGLGALLYRAPTPDSDAVVGFRLEYVDVPTAGDVLTFFDALRQTLPASLADELVWIPRSPVQMELAARLVTMGKLAPTQVLTFAELSTEGEAEIYNGGVAVGRLLLVENGKSALTDADPTRILVVETPPDDLPQAAGFISAAPLTALSHLNILAKNRGIPSAYVGGIFNDPWIRQLADGYAPVALSMQNGEVTVAPLSDAEFKRFQQGDQLIHVSPKVANEKAPYVVSLPQLQSLDEADVSALIGGKSAGFDVLFRAVPSAIPGAVAVVTTRAFFAHMAPLEKELETLFTHPVFLESQEVRYFVLEGKDAYLEAFSTYSDLQRIEHLKTASPLHYSVGQKGGLKAKIRSLPVPKQMLTTITRELKSIFGAYPKNQGLRFRSSSTVEDIDGFNGAGLYTSSTGFLYANHMDSAHDRARTVAFALKKTWASYFGFQAFEERENAGRDHLSGAMAVVVHPRFDDDAELANGVITFTWNFAGAYQMAERREQMTVNAQLGALSVTNPPPDVWARPEMVQLVALNGGSPAIARQCPSKVKNVEKQVLTDTSYLELFALCRRIAAEWNASKNSGGDGATRHQTITLDLEFRQMASTWGGFSGGRDAPAIVLKQVRALSPAAKIPGILEQHYRLPTDVLLQAIAVERHVCASGDVQMTFLRALPQEGNDTCAQDDMNAPFIGDVSVVAGNRMEVLGPAEYIQPGDGKVLVFSAAAAARMGISRIDWSALECDIQPLSTSNVIHLKSALANGRVVGRQKQLK